MREKIHDRDGTETTDREREREIVSESEIQTKEIYCGTRL